jgi:hypothetical protein
MMIDWLVDWNVNSTTFLITTSACSWLRKRGRHAYDWVINNPAVEGRTCLWNNLRRDELEGTLDFTRSIHQVFSKKMHSMSTWGFSVGSSL